MATVILNVPIKCDYLSFITNIAFLPVARLQSVEAVDFWFHYKTLISAEWHFYFQRNIESEDFMSKAALIYKGSDVILTCCKSHHAHEMNEERKLKPKFAYIKMSNLLLICCRFFLFCFFSVQILGSLN